MHEMKAFNDNMMLVREGFASFSLASDEHTRVRIDKKLRAYSCKTKELTARKTTATL